MKLEDCLKKLLYEIQYCILDLINECIGEKNTWNEIPLEEIKIDKIPFDYEEEDWTRV
jgi:hypothetical protein